MVTHRQMGVEYANFTHAAHTSVTCMPIGEGNRPARG
jgi:hypothetical protein